jgi:hypothetical protein
MPGMDNLPPEMIENIMDFVTQGCVNQPRSWRWGRSISIFGTPRIKDGLRDLVSFALSSKRYYDKYRAFEYVLSQHVIQQFVPHGPEMFDFVIWMSGLIMQPNNLHRPFSRGQIPLC